MNGAIVEAARSVAVSGGPRFRLWASCPGGCEAEAAAELAALGWRSTELSAREDTVTGRTAGLVWERGSVYGEADLAAVYKTLWAGRTVSRFGLLVTATDVDGLDAIDAVVRRHDWSLLPHAPFAIRARRHGSHPFRSADIARVAGAAVLDRYRAATGLRLPVDLDAPTTEVRVELAERRLRVGIELVAGSLHRRPYLVYRHPAPLKATVAACLLALARWSAGESLLDPFCGGGTILLEAALAGLRRPLREGGEDRLRALGLHDPGLAAAVRDAVAEAERTAIGPLVGVERFAHHVGGARRNAAAAGVAELVRFRQGDATRLDGIGPVDRVVTNPPFGIRAGRPAILRRLYGDALARLAERLAPGGRIVFLTPVEGLVRRLAVEAGLRVVAAKKISLGSLAAVAFVLGPARRPGGRPEGGGEGVVEHGEGAQRLAPEPLAEPPLRSEGADGNAAGRGEPLETPANALGRVRRDDEGPRPAAAEGSLRRLDAEGEPPRPPGAAEEADRSLELVRFRHEPSRPASPPRPRRVVAAPGRD